MITKEMRADFERYKAEARTFMPYAPIDRCPSRHINVCESVLGYLDRHGQITKGQRKAFGQHRIDLMEFVYAQVRRDISHFCRHALGRNR